MRAEAAVALELSGRHYLAVRHKIAGCMPRALCLPTFVVSPAWRGAVECGCHWAVCVEVPTIQSPRLILSKSLLKAVHVHLVFAILCANQYSILPKHAKTICGLSIPTCLHARAHTHAMQAGIELSCTIA